MANNYSQPFYGAPFQYPPPQMQHQAPSAPMDAPHGFPPMPQAPAPGAFQHIPGLQQPAHAPPNTNGTSYSQNAQQPPFPPAAWPTDQNAWFAFMQSVSQNGQLPPPPLPGFAFPPPSLPQTPQLPPTPTAFIPHPHHLVKANDRVQEVMDSDKEDGELSDSEGAAQQPAALPGLRNHVEPPRSVPQASRPSPRVEEAYNPDQPAAGQAVNKRAVQQPPQPPPTLSPMEAIQQSRDQAKQFIKLLHSNNMGYRTLANEQLDLDLLRELYSSLNLPSEPAPIAPLKANVIPMELSAVDQQDQSARSSDVPQQKPAPSIKTSVASAPAAKAAPSPVDRREYIARLQAAKLNAKQPGASKPSSPRKTPPATMQPPLQSVTTAHNATTPTTKPSVTSEQRARTTELIKQRLEALKAKGQSTPVPNGTGPSAPAVQKTEQSRTAPEQAAQPASFGLSNHSGIPGLFMSGPSSSSNHLVAVSKSASNIPQKRPAPSDSTGPSTPRGSVTPYTRPLGDSPHVYQEEPMIIEVSDDESHGSDMDIDDDQAPSKTAIATPSAAPNLRNYPGSLPDFPSHTGSVLPGSSAATTPGPQTPATQAREDELRRKEDELVAMRLKLRQKIADRVAKEKAEKAAAVTPTSTAQQQPPTISRTPKEVPATGGSVRSSTLDDAADLIQDVKRRRRAEIQTRLPSIDAEVASNTDRMAKLTRELEGLRASNERITRDRQRLVDELESLGVDTDGMSHAEMRAKKIEIEHERTPEPETNGQDTNLDLVFPTTTLLPTPQHDRPEDTGNNAEKQDLGSSIPAKHERTTQNIGIPGLSTYVPPKEENTARPSQASTIDESSQLDNSAGLGNVGSGMLAERYIAIESRQSATPPEDDEDFYSPPGAETGLGAGDAHIPNIVPAVDEEGKSEPPDADLVSEDGEIEMSESSEDEEEEYQPDEPTSAMETPVQGPQATVEQAVQRPVTSDVSTEDEEAYEPPDVDEAMSDMEDDAHANADADISHVEVDDGEMDIASSSSDDSDDSDDSEAESETRLGSSISASRNVHSQTNVADDLAPELQPGVATEPIPVEIEEEEEEVPKFTPYESPLRMFKSYRYHPNFAQDVSGGFLSATFSHQIDSEKPFCQYETAGGSCNDPECPFQHFRGMGITGETLLVQLGTANPGKTPEEKQQWNDGLRGVLKELRKKSIKDPNGIAAEIANYRRQFLNDDTRVVNL